MLMSKLGRVDNSKILSTILDSKALDPYFI